MCNRNRKSQRFQIANPKVSEKLNNIARNRNYKSQQDRTMAAISNRKCKTKLAKPCVLFCKIQQNLRIATRSRNINLIRIAKSQIAESPEWWNTKCLTCRFSPCRINTPPPPNRPTSTEIELAEAARSTRLSRSGPLNTRKERR